MSHARKLKTIAAGAILFTASLGSLPLVAQDEADEVIVVGTRSSQNRSVTDVPVPVDVVDKEELTAVGGDADAVESLTALIPSFSANPQQGDGTAFVRSASMRGVPADRTLILVNGKRRHRSALMHTGIATPDNQGSHAPDIGHIPTIALKNIEVLRDGAAAQYGSDAIAGVINLNLNDADSGKTVAVSYGQHFVGESNWKIAANAGAKLCGDGFLNISAETNYMEHLSRGGQNARAQALLDAGVEGVGADSMNPDGYVQTWGRPEQKGTRMVANMGCMVSENTKVYSFANYGHQNGLWSFYYRHPRAKWVNDAANGINDFTYNNPKKELDIEENDKNNNGMFDTDEGHAAFKGPYIKDATNLERDKQAGFTPRLHANQQDYSVVIGMKGKNLMGFNVDYDVSASRGYNKIDYTLQNSLNPSIPLGIECDDNLDNDPEMPNPDAEKNDDGKVVGDGNPDTSSPVQKCLGADGHGSLHAMRDFDTGDLRQRETNFNLDLTQALSGNMFLAYGLEYRQEEFTQYPGGWPARYEAGVSGMAGTKYADAGTNGQESYAAYADLEYDMSENLLLQAAGRFESSDYGSPITGKLAGRMKLTDTMALRGAVSLGFKAPTPGQANYKVTTTGFESDGTEVRTFQVASTSDKAMALGGTELENENSMNISFGMTSQFLRNMTLTADFYLIDLNNRLTLANIKGEKIGLVQEKISFFTNAMDTRNMGADVVLDYKLMANSSLTLAFNWNTVSVEERRDVGDTPGEEIINDAWVNAIEKARPEMRFTLTGRTSMMGDKIGLMGRMRYYGAHYDVADDKGTILEGDKPHSEIDPTAYFDLELTYRYSEDFHLVAGGMNVLNTYPTEILAKNNVQNLEAVHGMKYPIHSVADYQGGSWYLKGVYTF